MRRMLPFLVGVAVVASVQVLTTPSLVTAADAVVVVASQPFTVTEGRQSFVLDAGPGVPTDAVSLRVSVLRRLTSRSAVLDAANGTRLPSAVDRVTLPLSGIDRDPTGRWIAEPTFVFGRDRRDSLRLGTDGVHPLVFEFLDARGRIVAGTSTFIERRVTAQNGVATTLLMDLTPPRIIAPDGTVTVTADVRAEVGAALDLLRTSGPLVTALVSPELLAGLAAAEDEDDRGLLTELDAALAGRAVVNAPFGGADPSAMAAGGLAGEFGTQLALGRAALAELVPSAVVETRTWVARRRVDANGLLLLRNSGITSVLLGPDAVRSMAARDASALLSARADVGDGAAVEIVTTDVLLRSADVIRTSPRQAAARTMAEAVVAVDELLAGGEEPGSIRLALSHDGAVPADGSLSALATMMSAHPGFVLTSFAGAHSADDASPDVEPRGAGPRYTPEHARLLGVARRELDATSSMLPNGSANTDAWARSHALGADPDDADAVLHLSALRGVLRETRGLVSVTTPETVNLSSRDGEIRFQVRNNSDEEMTVVVAVASAKLRISEPVRTVTLVPRGTTEVRVPATTRTGGRFPVAVRVSTPEGDVNVVPWFTITANVSAIAGWGRLVSISLLLVLLAWWWSHRRSVRRRGAEEGTVRVP